MPVLRLLRRQNQTKSSSFQEKPSVKKHQVKSKKTRVISKATSVGNNTVHQAAYVAFLGFKRNENACDGIQKEEKYSLYEKLDGTVT